MKDKYVLIFTVALFVVGFSMYKIGYSRGYGAGCQTSLIEAGKEVGKNKAVKKVFDIIR